jgi:hypothetical protein
MARDRHFDDPDDGDDFPDRPKPSNTPLVLGLVVVGVLLVVVLGGGAAALFMVRGKDRDARAEMTVADAHEATAMREGPPRNLVNEPQDRAAVFDEPPRVAPPGGAPNFRLQSVAFAKELTRDPDGFAAKYARKQIELTGVVEGVNEDVGGTGQLLLAGDPDARLPRVVCRTREPEPWTQALPGQTVLLQGVGTDRAVGMPILSDCVVVNVTGEPPPTIKAGDLAKEFVADPAAAEKKWDKKFLVLTGRVKAAPTPANGGGISLPLESDPAVPKVAPVFGLIDQKRLDRVRPGQQVRVLAQCRGISAEKDKLLFMECCLLGG